MKLHKKIIYILSIIFIALIIIIIILGGNKRIVNNDIIFLNMRGNNFYLLILLITNGFLVSLIYSIIAYYKIRKEKLDLLHDIMFNLYDSTNLISKECNKIRTQINYGKEYKTIKKSHEKIKSLSSSIQLINNDLIKLNFDSFIPRTKIYKLTRVTEHVSNHVVKCNSSIDSALYSLNELEKINNQIEKQLKLTNDIELFLNKKKIINNTVEDRMLNLFCNSERVKILSYEVLNNLYLINKNYDGIGKIKAFEKDVDKIKYEIKIDINKYSSIIKKVKFNLKSIEKEIQNLHKKGTESYIEVINEIDAFVNELLLVIDDDDLLIEEIKLVRKKYNDIINIIETIIIKKGKNSKSKKKNDVDITNEITQIKDYITDLKISLDKLKDTIKQKDKTLKNC